MHLDKFLVGAGIAATAFARGVPHHSHVARQNQYQQQTVIATTTVHATKYITVNPRSNPTGNPTGYTPPSNTGHPNNPGGNGKQVALYWGQNGGSAAENNDLSSYCTGDTGADVLILAFIYTFGLGQSLQGQINSCNIPATAECTAISQSIQKCQQAGKKIIVSLGGAVGNHGFNSDQEATDLADQLWSLFGPAGSSSAPSSYGTRPFGQQVVDGFDMDIESTEGAQYYPTLIKALRQKFDADSSKKYYITGAPQCPDPEPNMGTMIQNAPFDMLFIQFYNNPSCSIDNAISGGGGFNYDSWVTTTAGGQSKNAQLFIGVPADELGATGAEAGAKYYAQPDQLQKVVQQYSSHERFGGVMLWSAAWSTFNDDYAKKVKSILGS